MPRHGVAECPLHQVKGLPGLLLPLPLSSDSAASPKALYIKTSVLNTGPEIPRTFFSESRVFRVYQSPTHQDPGLRVFKCLYIEIQTLSSGL